MARVPEPGTVKTRLAEEIGDDRAAELYRDMGAHCVRRMRAVAASGEVDLEVRIEGAVHAARAWLGHGMTIRAQRGADLGERLARAIREAFDSDAPAVLAVGTDCPELGGREVRETLDALAKAEVVFGPAEDGGYYLVGMRADVMHRALACLFGPQIPWGTGGVLERSVDAARAFGLSVALGTPLRDVDRAEDVAVWQRVRDRLERTRTAPRTSVVIPTLDEAAEVGDAVRSAQSAGVLEIVVADASESPDTARAAKQAGARVVRSERGRARQLNAGAAAATGDVLLFLHADTRLPAEAADQVRAVLDDSRVALGSFRYGTREPDDATGAVIRAGGDWRHILFGLPYGDQAQFCRTADFVDVGGFPVMPTMEDYEFALRMRRLGRIGTAPCRVSTSTRAWREHGLTRTTLTNARVIAGYRLGVTQERLADWRRGIAR